MQRLRIGVDFDGTPAETGEIICAMMNYAEGTNYTVRDWLHWDWPRETPQREKAFWGAYDLMDRTGARIGAKPYDAHVRRVLALLSLRHDVHIVTNNLPIAEPTIRAWLRINAPEVAQIPIKCLGRGSPRQKLESGYDILIDDAPPLIKAVSQDPTKMILIPNCRWNEFYDAALTQPIVDLPNARRFRSWDEVPGLIEEFLKRKVST